ncbi:hypothetical protein ACQKCU_24690 [Heyndrickxia sporothermodurans]
MKESQERGKKLYQTIEDQNEILNRFSEKYDVAIIPLILAIVELFKRGDTGILLDLMLKLKTIKNYCCRRY